MFTKMGNGTINFWDTRYGVTDMGGVKMGGEEHPGS